MKQCLATWVLMISALSSADVLAGFALKTSHIPGFEQPTSAGVVIADFDGDGLDDVAVAGGQALNSSMPTGLVGVVRFDTDSGVYSVQSSVAV